MSPGVSQAFHHMQNQISRLAAHMPKIGNELNKLHGRIDTVGTTVANHTTQLAQLSAGAPTPAMLIGMKVAKIVGNERQLSYSIGEVVADSVDDVAPETTFSNGLGETYLIRWTSGQSERAPFAVVQMYHQNFTQQAQIAPVPQQIVPAQYIVPAPAVVAPVLKALRHLIMGSAYQQFADMLLPKKEWIPKKVADRSPGQKPVADTVTSFLLRTVAGSKSSTGVSFPVINQIRSYSIKDIASIEQAGWGIAQDTKSPGATNIGTANKMVVFFTDNLPSLRTFADLQPRSLVDNKGYLLEVADVSEISPSDYPGLMMSKNEDPRGYANRLEEFLIRLGGISGATACNHQYGNGVMTVHLLRCGIEPERICPTISRVPGNSSHNSTDFDDFVVLAKGQLHEGHVIQIKMTFQDARTGKSFYVSSHGAALLRKTESSLPPYDLLFVLTWLPQRGAKSLEDEPVLPKKRQELGQLLVTPTPRPKKKVKKAKKAKQ
jgi:hypothetical protein